MIYKVETEYQKLVLGILIQTTSSTNVKLQKRMKNIRIWLGSWSIASVMIVLNAFVKNLQ